MIAQQQKQQQQLKILPQQIQLLNLYFLNSLELEQRIKNELEENPFIEATEKKDETEIKPSKDTAQDFHDWDEMNSSDVPDYKFEYQNYFDTAVAPNMPITGSSTFKEDAIKQLQLLYIDDKDRANSEYLIHALNGNGFLDTPIEAIVEDMSFRMQRIVDEADIRRAQNIVKSLEPIGIGSGNIQECLLAQLYALESDKPLVRTAIAMLERHYNDLMHRQFEKICHSLKINEADLKSILGIIGGLKFTPVVETAGMDHKNTIIPDFIITNYGDDIQVNLYSSRTGTLFINQALHDQLAGQVSNKDRGACQYIKSKLSAAEWFVNAVRQREDTMLRIMKHIVTFQKDFFIHGDLRLLKPMVLRNVAEVSGYDISTISRITSNKYAETHFGIIYLKQLFSEGIADKKGEVISNKVIRSVIEEAIRTEDKKHPFTDQQLVNILSSNGYNIARRTIAKYREQMKIPIAQIRAVWA